MNPNNTLGQLAQEISKVVLKAMSSWPHLWRLLVLVATCAVIAVVLHWLIR